MREIKFQVFDTRVNEMFGNEMALKLLAQAAVLPSVHKTYKFRQYTGLKDKNGVEIYEGDIVYMVANGVNGPREIQFLNGAFGIKPLKVSEDLWWIEVWHMDVKIIGNVWENPKLLEANHE